MLKDIEWHELLCLDLGANIELGFAEWNWIGFCSGSAWLPTSVKISPRTISMLELECTVRNIQEYVGYKVEVNTHHPSTRYKMKFKRNIPLNYTYH